ncbi:MAG: MarR family winged helix-turn-helix transcriptional regulator [Deferribacterales bacterium]|jgi:DNA-binding MarR family transcriptional regulator
MKELSRILVEFYDKMSSWENDMVRGTGLTLQQVHTIEVLGAHGDMKMKELAAKMGITTGTMTINIDKLEKTGYVERKPNEQDRRSTLVGLTASGKELFEAHDDMHLLLTKEITSSMDEKERKDLSRLLEKLLEGF